MELSPQHHRTGHSSLSPVPPSPERQCAPQYTNSNNATSQYSAGAYNQPNTLPAQATPSAQLKPEQAAEKPKVKRPRKKKEDGDAPAPAPAPAPTADGAEKPKKPRKPREPKDPNAPPKKRAKKNPEEAGAPAAKPSATTSANLQSIQPQPQAPTQSSSGLQPPPSSLLHARLQGSPAAASQGYGQIGKTEPSSENVSSPHQFGALQSTPQPAPHNRTQSGHRAAYDPIRSASLENARLAGTPTPTPSSTYASPALQRTAPSIQNLTEPLPPPKPTVTATSNSLGPAPTSRPPPTEPKRKTPPKLAPAPSATPQPTSIAEAARNLNLIPNGATADKSMGEKLAARAETASRPLSPKPTTLARKKQSPPVAMGSGLLSGADFGRKGPSEPKQYAQVPNNCIVIDVPMKGQENNYVNFLQEVEKKYGFDVAHPRIAEHRRRMAQMAAAGAAIESTNGTADEMSLDLSSMEDSDVEMGEGGVANPDGESGAVSEGKKKKKVTRHDKYDLEDEFIDDTEQAWAEQALASNDGYFVWCGPLVPPEEEPRIAKANGKVTRGRGGRGRGARGGGAGTTRGGKTDTGNGEKKSARGGGTTQRKPRMKKSEKEALEKEKEKNEREKAGASTSTKAITEIAEVSGVAGAS